MINNTCSSADLSGSIIQWDSPNTSSSPFQLARAMVPLPHDLQHNYSLFLGCLPCTSIMQTAEKNTESFMGEWGLWRPDVLFVCVDKKLNMHPCTQQCCLKQCKSYTHILGAWVDICGIVACMRIIRLWRHCSVWLKEQLKTRWYFKKWQTHTDYQVDKKNTSQNQLKNH